jgi:maltooligosyltrehalose trehalohydrolase
VPGAGPGTDYAFSLDGGPRRPDPRSPWQPHGVHGPSRTVDHAAFRWTDRAWQAPPLAAAIFYEMHIGTFTPGGTFDSAIERLGHLVDLGVTHVEVMPVVEFPGRRGWGYDGVALFAPHHALGGPAGLKRLVDACHARGLAVILDVVYNHLGPSGNYLAEFGPYFTDRHHTPWGQAVNLDGPESDEVRQFLIDNAVGWLRDYHLDGLRLDAVHALIDTSATHFLEELVVAVDRLEGHLGRHLLLVAESDLNDPRIVRPTNIGGYGVDAQWSDDFHHALHAVLTGETDGYYADFGRLADLATVHQDVFLHTGQYSAHRRRRHGRAPTGIPSHRFLGYLQNHDQIGNRATGERSAHLLGLERLKIGAALVLLSPFVPMLFMGEEWGARTPFLYFTDHDDPELGRLVSEGRRREFAAFGWRPEAVPDPQAAETFERSRLDWAEREREPHRGLLDWHKRLIALRRAHPALSDGRREEVGAWCDGAERWLVVARGSIRIACNLSDRARTVPLPGLGGEAILALASADDIERADGGVRLPPDSIAVLVGRPGAHERTSLGEIGQGRATRRADAAHDGRRSVVEMT